MRRSATGIEPTVIELNVDTVRRLRGEGIRAVYGDAGHRDTLTAANIAPGRQPGADHRSPGERGVDPGGARAEPRDPRAGADHAPAAVEGVPSRGGEDRVLGRGRNGPRPRRGDAAPARRDARSDRPRARARSLGAGSVGWRRRLRSCRGALQ
ncbi:MAG: hypothetical protein GEU82_14670 [Luteitalea sp.]|nr:hypothetical protein [Luteitalea sp.]